MKVLHICLGNFYVDNYSYQENMLPKFHKELGLDVEILTSLVSFDSTGKPCLLKEGGHYINEHGIPVTRLEYKNSFISSKLRQYKGTYEALRRSNPSIIFIHNCQFLDIIHVKAYVKRNPDIKVYVDNHADFFNSARTFLSYNILHKIIWRKCAHLIEPYTTKFYGVIPARVDFLKNVYKLPEEKVELLVMGADDEKVKEAKNPNVKKEIRKKYNIKPDDFLIVTGGKIDYAKKQTLLLMQAVKNINKENVKLLVFGSVESGLKEKLNALVDGEKIQYVGWIPADETYNHFAASDLVVFPGRHSVFWEQAVGTGLPCIFKYWEGTTHVDLGGNCEFLYEDSVDEIYEVLLSFIKNKDKLDKMRSNAEAKGIQYFSYKEISSKAIDV